jgi:hypothetical protein
MVFFAKTAIEMARDKLNRQMVEVGGVKKQHLTH